MIRFAHPTIAAATLALGACGPSENEPAPGGVTVSEAQALDEAAEMIEQRRLPEGAIAPESDGEPAPEADVEQGE